MDGKFRQAAGDERPVIDKSLNSKTGKADFAGSYYLYSQIRQIFFDKNFFSYNVLP